MNNYPELKMLNPAMPILVREGAETMPTLVARFGAPNDTPLPAALSKPRVAVDASCALAGGAARACRQLQRWLAWAHGCTTRQHRGMESPRF